MLDNINDLLNLGVGQIVRLRKIKEDIQAKKTLWSADIHYVEELSKSFLQKEKKLGMPKNEKMIIIGTVLAIGLFFVFFIIPVPGNDFISEKLNLGESIPEESTSETSGDESSSLETVPNPEDKFPDSGEPLPNNEEFSSASTIQSSSSTQP